MVKCSYNHFNVTRLSFAENFRKVLINACDLVTDLIETYSRQTPKTALKELYSDILKMQTCPSSVLGIGLLRK